MLCARVSNFGSISCNSESVKYRRVTGGDSSGPGWDALLRAGHVRSGPGWDALLSAGHVVVGERIEARRLEN